MADTATAEGQQLQSALHQIDTLHHTLGQAVTGFDQLFGEHAAPAQAAAPHDAGAEVQQTADQLHELAQTIGSELGQKLVAAIEALHAQTQSAIQSVQAHSSDWEAAYTSLKGALTTLEQTLEQATGDVTQVVGELQRGVETAGEATNHLLENVAKSVSTVHGELSQTVDDTLKKASGDFHDTVSGALSGKLTEHLNSVFSNGRDALSNVEQTATHLFQEFGHEAETALTSFAHDVADNIKNQLEAAGEKLAKDCMELLSAKVAASIAEGTAGAAITGAMAPILPEVIVVKEASEAIKDLISVFKSVASIF